MARLNECRDSEEDLPELSTLFAKCSVAENDEKQATTLRPLSTESKILYGGPQRERKPLKTTHGNSLLLPIANGLLIPRKSFQRDDECGTSDLEKSGGQRAIVEAVNYNLSREPLSVDSSVRESSLGNNILRFVCRLPPVDAEHGGSQPYGKDAFGQFRSPKGNEYKDLKDTTENTNKSYQQFQRDGQLRDLNPSRPTSKKAAVFDSQVSSSNINDENSISGNGTQSNTPTQPAIRVKSGTPATNPSSPKLKSPAKQDRHPRSLYRPSVDTFWSQEAIEGWNLQYTPKKPPKSPSKVKPHRLEEGYGDYESPYKQFPSMEKKPSPKKQVLERQRAFNATRQNLATTFLRELDDTITNGQVASLAASTGGVKICWSKTLQSTAGRAKWKRESVRAKDCSEYPGAKTYRHHASIELAEKVIDDEGNDETLWCIPALVS